MAKKSNAEEVLKFHELGMSIDEIADYLGIYSWFVKLVIKQKGSKVDEF